MFLYSLYFTSVKGDAKMWRTYVVELWVQLQYLSLSVKKNFAIKPSA